MKSKAKPKAGESKTPHTDRQIARGDWNPLWDTLREWDPAFVEGYLTTPGQQAQEARKLVEDAGFEVEQLEVGTSLPVAQETAD